MSEDNILNPYSNDDYERLSNLEYLCKNIDTEEISNFIQYIYDSDDENDNNNNFINKLDYKIIELFNNIPEKTIECYDEYVYFLIDNENIKPIKNINGSFSSQFNI